MVKALFFFMSILDIRRHFFLRFSVYSKIIFSVYIFFLFKFCVFHGLFFGGNLACISISFKHFSF